MSRIRPLLLCLALAGCATSRPADQSGELVWISVRGERDCMVGVEDRLFALPDAERRLDRHLRGLARSRQGAVLGGADVPPSLRCWAAAMFVAQRAGFRRLGFISPPDGADGRSPPDGAD